MLRVESALAAAQAESGLIAPESGAAIARACETAELDALAIGLDAQASVQPVVPFVEALRAAVPEVSRADVHLAATSQDILDTASMLVARHALALMLESLRVASEGCAVLAHAHQSTVMAGRTLLQQAMPTTFGLKAAGWMRGLDDAAIAIKRVGGGLALQFGGAVGTLAGSGGRGMEVAARMGESLGLRCPDLPWHVHRGRVVELASSVALAAGAASKVATDIVLLSQSEIGEVREGVPGGSSSMPHKQNPAGSVAVIAAARRAHALMPVFYASMSGEHERSAGGWQAEWGALSDLFLIAHAAVEGTARVLAGLRVSPERMRANCTGDDVGEAGSLVRHALAAHRRDWRRIGAR
jgi:3-carboxy-cis,cis-muconate cycloisomerase